MATDDWCMGSHPAAPCPYRNTAVDPLFRGSRTSRVLRTSSGDNNLVRDLAICAEEVSFSHQPPPIRRQTLLQSLSPSSRTGFDQLASCNTYGLLVGTRLWRVWRMSLVVPSTLQVPGSKAEAGGIQLLSSNLRNLP
jgi:hypothetical protein